MRHGMRSAAILVGFLLALVVMLGAPASAAPAQVSPTPAATAPSTAPSTTTTVPAVPAPGTPATPSQPGLQLELPTGDSPLNSPVSLVLLLGAITFVPALLIMTTAFTRIVIVLGFVRTALGTNGIPPNQVVIGLALFLSLFVMAPTFGEANETALQPLTRGEISQTEALQRAIVPFREFMLKQVRDEDLAMFVKFSGDERPANPSDVATTTLVPAFLLSELRTAFLIGFVIFIPFILIDLIVSAALSAMGMVMLPPVLISLPFKLLLFVAANGWTLIVGSLLESFNA
jgi:flagellar biosynthetic protein FliP